MNTTELEQREQRAQRGMLQFAEEMQAIRDGRLYPNANQWPDAWKTYCKERWGMSDGHIDTAIRALPVVRRLNLGGTKVEISFEAASRIATLPEPVQDAIVAETTKLENVQTKAKAVRKQAKKADREGRKATDGELIEAATSAQPKKTKPKKTKVPDSQFVGNLSSAHHYIEVAANIAHRTELSETENDWAYKMAQKIDYELARLREQLVRPSHDRDMDEEFASLLNGEQS